jgi:hypothetical protein
MKNQLSRVALLVAILFTVAGCQAVRPDPQSQRKGRPTQRQLQTGTNIPRAVPTRTESRQTRNRAESEARRARPKASPTPKPTPKPRRPARGPVDEDVITRGGFR